MDQKSLKKLQAEWEQRLAKEGLGEFLDPASDAYRDIEPMDRELKLGFFLQASACCQHTQFRRHRDRLIMDLFCDGRPKHEIAEEVRLGRDAVQDVIRKYLILFGLYGVYGKYLCDQRIKRGGSGA